MPDIVGPKGAPIAGALKGEVDKLLEQQPAAPARGGQLEVDVTKDGVEGEISGAVGKGWSVGAWGSWMKGTGYAVAGKIKKTWGGPR